VSFNRINGFYVGRWFCQEIESMTLEERNQEINKALETRFNQLNSAIEAHETKLVKMMVTRDAWVEYHSCEDNPDNPSGAYKYYLGMIKERGAWRLCHGHAYESYIGDRPDEGIDWKPLVDESVETRIKSAAHIDKLRAAIVESKERLVPELEDAIQTLAKSLS
jgi:hypothetical protein